MLFPGAVPWQHGGGQQTGFSLPEKKERCWRKEATEQKEGRVEAADIILLMITSRAGESNGLFLKSGVVRVELLSQCEQ